MSSFNAARYVVEGLLPVGGGERLLPRHCVRASIAAADIKPGGVGMLVAGLCLALGGEPNLRKNNKVAAGSRFSVLPLFRLLFW